MIVVKADDLISLALGRQGENLARQVVFDLSDWTAEYGDGTAELIVQRPGEDAPYPAVIAQDGAVVTWTLTSADTALASSFGVNGHCELRWYVGDVLVKSKIWRTWVDKAMDAPDGETPPEPEQGWVDQVVAVGAAAKASADAAKADADRAAALAAEVAEKAAQAAQDASDAAKAMEAAQTAQRLAEEAQGAAETARTAAETAQAAAEQSATDAAGAKQDAETALKSAQDAAAAAAKALADIRALYQEMQTWAQGVIQDVNAAGSIAVQSVQSAGDTQVQRVTDEGTTQTANAKAQADAAAQSASGAAQSAQEAAESAAVYGDVVADVNQLKQDVAAITPDDNTVDGKPWSSKHIIDTLCPPISETGNPVVCYPVKNYPLGVKVSLEPVQEGTGDPSPDNVRPISGWTGAKVTRTGKNLLKLDESEMVSAGWNRRFPISLKAGTYIISCQNQFGTSPKGAFVSLTDENDATIIKALTSGYSFGNTTFVGVAATITEEEAKKIKNIRFALRGIGATYNDIAQGNIQLELGTTSTSYEPYQGNTYDIAFPSEAGTVYGGTLDVTSGVLTVDRAFVLLNDASKWIASQSITTPYVYNTNFSNRKKYSDSYTGLLCSAMPVNSANQNFTARWSGSTSNTFGVKATSPELSIDEFKNLSSNGELAISYELATPQTYHLTPQEIAALSGVNTLYTDADGVVVTGAEDPKHTITELKNAIISLGGNI